MRSQRGLSTAELLAGLTLTLIIVAALQSFQRAQTKALAAANAYSDTQAASRGVLDLMTRELRMATFDPTRAALTPAPGPSCPGARQGILEATSTRIHFRQDLNGDGTIAAIAGSGEDVVFALAGNGIERIDGGGLPAVLADGIPSGGFILRYFDGSNPPVELVPGGDPAALTAGQRDCVAKVRLFVRSELTNPDPHIRTPLVSMAESEVAVRNRSLDNF